MSEGPKGLRSGGQQVARNILVGTERVIQLNRNVVDAFHHSSALTREQIWHPDPPYVPSVRVAFSMLPRPGFVGADWCEGGVVLVGSNGNSAEDGNWQKFSESDNHHAELISEFRDTSGEQSFLRLMEFERQDIRRWSLRSTIDQVTARLGISMDETAILNVIPFSTVGAPPPSSPAWSNAVKLHLQPVLRALNPGKVVWLGKTAASRASTLLSFDPPNGFGVVSRQRNLNWETRLRGI